GESAEEEEEGEREAQDARQAVVAKKAPEADWSGEPFTALQTWTGSRPGRIVRNSTGRSAMKNAVRVAVGVALCAVAVGCVASSKYNKLQAEQTALQSEQQKLQESAKQLQDQNARLESDVAALKAQNDALTAMRDSLQQKQVETASKYDQVVDQLSSEVK